MDLSEHSPATKKQRTPRRPTDKGALYYEYNTHVHEFVTHIRRVHSTNPDVNIGGKTVKAANAMAPPGTPLYYVHGKTKLYNSIFFDWFDSAFVRTFSLVCPFYDYQSVDDLEKLLDAEVER